MKGIDITKIPTLNVIIAGHIDHGKTTLLYKLTNKWTDTHSEELKRGITIKLGYADLIIYKDKDTFTKEPKGEPYRYISFIDAPGHEMLMATMLSGAAIVDAAILVIAANEGIKPQTREHLIALQAKQIKNIIVVQNKIDLATKEQTLKNHSEIKKLLLGTSAEKIPIIPISAQQEVNINILYEALCSLPIPERNEKGNPLFIAARSFDINKPGTLPVNLKGAVLGGTLKQGTLKVGDKIEIKPGLQIKEANQIKYHALTTKIRNLFKGTHRVEQITPGGSVSIETELDMSLAKSDALSGCTLSTEGKLPEITSELTMSYNLFPSALGSQQPSQVQPLKPTEMLMLSINTSVTVGIIKKLKGNQAELSLRIPIVPFKGENIAIARNINNHWRLIGYGKIV